MKQLDITQAKARKLVNQICEDFVLPKCAVYFVDLTFLDLLGIYTEKQSEIGAYMLVENRWSRRLVIVLHEITHHLQNEYYNKGSHHGSGFQLAKRRMATWAKNNISDHFDWFSLITAHTTGRMRCKKKKTKKKK